MDKNTRRLVWAAVIVVALAIVATWQGGEWFARKHNNNPERVGNGVVEPMTGLPKGDGPTVVKPMRPLVKPAAFRRLPNCRTSKSGAYLLTRTQRAACLHMRALGVPPEYIHYTEDGGVFVDAFRWDADGDPTVRPKVKPHWERLGHVA